MSNYTTKINAHKATIKRMLKAMDQNGNALTQITLSGFAIYLNISKPRK